MEEASQKLEKEFRKSRFDVKKSRVVVQSGGANDPNSKMLSVKSEHVIYNGES